MLSARKDSNTMPSFKAVVIPGDKRNDGTYNVKIRVLHNRGQRRIPTSLYARPSDLTRSLKLKSPEILSKCDGLIVQMRDAISDINPFDTSASVKYNSFPFMAEDKVVRLVPRSWANSPFVLIIPVRMHWS